MKKSLSLTLPSKIGMNKGTAVLAVFVGSVAIGISFAVNRFDNPVTRAVSSVRSGELPTTLMGV